MISVDKPDVGPNIIESIFMNYLIVIYEQIYQSTKENSSEIMKTFHMLLDTLEPYFIWDYLLKNVDRILTEEEDRDSLTAGASLSQICGIIHMLIDISLSESSIDLLSEHLPEMFYRLMKMIDENLERLQSNQMILCLEMLCKIYRNLISNESADHAPNPIEQDDQTIIESLLRQMVEKIDRQLSNVTPAASKILSPSYHYIEESIKLYKRFFRSFVHRKLLDENQPIVFKEKCSSLFSSIPRHANESLTEIFHHYQQSSEFNLKVNDNIQQYQSTFEHCCQLLIEFSSFSHTKSIYRINCFVEIIRFVFRYHRLR